MSVVESANATTTFAGLRALAGCGGCAAKAPRDLVAMLGQVAAAAGVGAEALVGLTPYDDAAVYALDSERALVATVDFFPPLVDDPEDYGAIAAANAVSDIYAMGGSVAFALVVSGFPAVVPADVIARVAGAAAAVVRQCGGSVLGGHSIRCDEPVFGLCVLGFVHPERIWRKCGARAGDVLMLSKPLGTGLLVSANRPEPLAAAIASMKSTNRAAAAALQALARAPHAVTDVSGFGLVGHLEEMLTQSRVSARLESDRVPLLAGALAAAQAGVRTSAHRHARPSGSVLEFAGHVSQELQALVTDPQTSGGLLVAVDATNVAALTSAGFATIGTVSCGPARLLVC